MTIMIILIATLVPYIVSNRHFNEDYKPVWVFEVFIDIWLIWLKSGIFLFSKGKWCWATVNPRRKNLKRWNNWFICSLKVPGDTFCSRLCKWTLFGFLCNFPFHLLTHLLNFLICFTTCCKHLESPLITFSIPILISIDSFYLSIWETQGLLSAILFCSGSTYAISILLERIIKSYTKYQCLVVVSDSSLKEFRL